MKLISRISNLDRRIIFLCIALSVAIPVLLQLTFPEFPTKMTQDMFDYVDVMPAGSKILVSLDYDPASEPELRPMAIAFIRHSLMKGHKLCFMTLFPAGQQQITYLIDNIIKNEFSEREYGVDYVNLGYKAGWQSVIAVIATNFGKLFSSDVNSTSLDDLPIMKGVKSLADFSTVVSFTTGWPGIKEWIQFGTDPLNKKLLGGATAVNTPLFFPYYPKQLAGLLGGIKGAAEYESLLAKKYERYSDPKMHIGILRWGPQTVAHIVIVGLLIIGNIFYFLERRMKRRK